VDECKPLPTILALRDRFLMVAPLRSALGMITTLPSGSSSRIVECHLQISGATRRRNPKKIEHETSSVVLDFEESVVVVVDSEEREVTL